MREFCTWDGQICNAGGSESQDRLTKQAWAARGDSDHRADDLSAVSRNLLQESTLAQTAAPMASSARTGCDRGGALDLPKQASRAVILVERRETQAQQIARSALA
jgi:hypothetical protein